MGEDLGAHGASWGVGTGVWGAGPPRACRRGCRWASQVGMEAGRALEVQTPPAALLSAGPVSLRTGWPSRGGSAGARWCDAQGSVSVWRVSPAGQAAVGHRGLGPPRVPLQCWGVDNNARLTTRTPYGNNCGQTRPWEPPRPPTTGAGTGPVRPSAAPEQSRRPAPRPPAPAPCVPPPCLRAPDSTRSHQ